MAASSGDELLAPSSFTLPPIEAPLPLPLAGLALPAQEVRVARPIEPAADDRLVSILGVHITDVTRARAGEILQAMLADGTRPRAVYFVNAHTLNLAAADESYRQALNSGDRVFGDGTGVRWAARMQGVRLRANLCGTDVVPELLRSIAGQDCRVFLLGGDQPTVNAAAASFERNFPNAILAGAHHGYVQTPDAAEEAIDAINASAADLLLVGMGNPLQEQWIHRHRRALRVRLCLGVGGLFHYWAGALRRSPAWLRRLGAEWLGILLQQPHKAARYLLGNPRFLSRALADAWRRRLEA